MLQLYLLTVLSNLLSGLILANGFVSSRFASISRYLDFQNNTVYRFIVGCGTFLVGLINLFTAYPGNVPILGDLFPSLLGMAGGLLIMTMWFNSRSEKVVEAEKNDSENDSGMTGMSKRVESVAGPYTTALGIAAIVSALLHAILPKLTLI